MNENSSDRGRNTGAEAILISSLRVLYSALNVIVSNSYWFRRFKENPLGNIT